MATVLIAVGSFGPWATLGIFKANGLDGGNDGWITLVVAALAAAVIWQYFVNPRRRLGIWLALLALIALGVAAYDAQDISDRSADFFGTKVSPDVGWGIWVVIVGAVALAAIGLLLARTPPSGARELAGDVSHRDTNT